MASSIACRLRCSDSVRDLFDASIWLSIAATCRLAARSAPKYAITPPPRPNSPAIKVCHRSTKVIAARRSRRNRHPERVGFRDPRTLLRALPCGDPPAALTPPPDASQLGVKEARLGRGTRRPVGRHRRRWRRIELRQDAPEALDPWREDEALTVDRGADRLQDLGAFFSGKIQCWHCGNVGCPRSGTNSKSSDLSSQASRSTPG